MKNAISLLIAFLCVATVAHAAPPGKTYEAKLWLEGNARLFLQGRPKVPLVGAILGALFGRIAYKREVTR